MPEQPSLDEQTEIKKRAIRRVIVASVLVAAAIAALTVLTRYNSEAPVTQTTTPDTVLPSEEQPEPTIAEPEELEKPEEIVAPPPPEPEQAEVAAPPPAPQAEAQPATPPPPPRSGERTRHGPTGAKSRQTHARQARRGSRSFRPPQPGQTC